MKKIHEFLNVEETAELAEELDKATDNLKETILDNRIACLADIDPDVLENRIDLMIQQCFLQSFAVMKLAIAKFASEHEDEDIETALTLFIELIQKKCTEFTEACELQEIVLDMFENQFDESLDELDELDESLYQLHDEDE